MICPSEQTRTAATPKTDCAPLRQTEFEQRLADESGSDPNGFGPWICREMAVRYGGGFGLGKPGSFATTLDFRIPNRAFNNHHETATD